MDSLDLNLFRMFVRTSKTVNSTLELSVPDNTFGRKHFHILKNKFSFKKINFEAEGRHGTLFGSSPASLLTRSKVV